MWVKIAVHVVTDRDEAHVQQRKYVFQILADADIVSAETRQILDDDAVDNTGAQVDNHALKVRAVEVGAGVAVINVQSGHSHVGLRVYELGQQFALAGDAVAFFAVAVLT